jgi:hypothetical protein
MVMYESDKCMGYINGKLFKVKGLFKVEQYECIGYCVTNLRIVCNLTNLIYVLLSAILH